jgi:hypothetical protein
VGTGFSPSAAPSIFKAGTFFRGALIHPKKVPSSISWECFTTFLAPILEIVEPDLHKLKILQN